MFTDIEFKLKQVAVIAVFCGIGGFFLGCIIVILGEPIIGFVVGCFCLGTGFAGAWFIYGFAELIECQKEIKNTLKLAFAQNISQETERQREIEDRRKMERLKEEEQQQVEKRKKEERIKKYWENHTDEREALIKKRDEAISKIREVGGLASKHREALERIIKEIDEEFEKDREEL